MVVEDVVKVFGKLTSTTYVGVEDFPDKLSFLFSVSILTISIMIVTVKMYIFTPLACYTSNHPSGLNFDKYAENYCWVHGTIVIFSGEKIPQNNKEWAILDKERRITYYQWVPFILGLQCIMFYVPRIIWQLICYNKVGTNLENLLNEAKTASNNAPKERKDIVNTLSSTIDDMLYQHRDYRQGKISKIRRKIYNQCNFCICSKHMGTWLILSYMFTKILYCVNVFSQLSIMKSFLGFNESIFSFGYIILKNIINGRYWDKSGIFPRITYCVIDNVPNLVLENTYIAQCALPINMLNEKIYIFLWFWILFVGIITVISIPLWFYRIAFLKNRRKFIKKFLLVQETYSHCEGSLLNHFLNDFLGYDGVFLIRMIYINAGDLITSEIVRRLWEIYKEKYKGIDFRNYCISITKEDSDKDSIEGMV